MDELGQRTLLSGIKIMLSPFNLICVENYCEMGCFLRYVIVSLSGCSVGSQNIADRLLHSLILVALGLLVGYETRPSISWHYLLWLIGWSVSWDCLSHNRLGAHVASGNFHQFSQFSHWQSPCTALLLCERLWKSLNSRWGIPQVTRLPQRLSAEVEDQ